MFRVYEVVGFWVIHDVFSVMRIGEGIHLRRPGIFVYRAC